MEQSKVLVGLHLGKTGGTTLHNHVHAELGDATRYYTSGLNADMARVMRGDLLLTEMATETKARLCFVFGHHFHIDDTLLFPPQRLTLFTILRDPFERFISTYKHYLRHRIDSGAALSPKGFVDRLRPNSQSEAICGVFHDMARQSSALTTRVTSALEGLDLVFSTDDLDAEATYLCRIVGLQGPTERKRVSTDTIETLDVTRDDIYERDWLDREIHERLKCKANWRINPFGTDKSRRNAVVDRLNGRSRERQIEESYHRLFTRMVQHKKLSAFGMIVDRRRPEVGRLFKRYCEETGASCEPASVTEVANAAAIHYDLGLFEKAVTLARQALEQDANSFSACFTLAKASRRLGLRHDAASACRRAIQLNSTNHTVRELLKQLT